MALLSSKSASSDVNGDVLSIATTAHAETHTLVVKPAGGATGYVDVYIRCVGGNFEKLQTNGSNTRVNLANPISPVFIACISEAKCVGDTVVGTYTVTLNSQGTKPETD